MYLCVVFLAVCTTTCVGWGRWGQLFYHRPNNHRRHLCADCSYAGSHRLLLCYSCWQVCSQLDHTPADYQTTHWLSVAPVIITRSSGTAEIARDAWNGRSRSLKVIRCRANRRGIYNFVLALNSNLTVLEISLVVCTSIPHLSYMSNWKKLAGSRWMWFVVRVPRTLDYPNIKLNPRWSASYDHNACPSQTDRQTDRRMSIMTVAWQFVLTNASRTNSDDDNKRGDWRPRWMSLRGFSSMTLTEEFATSLVTFAANVTSVGLITILHTTTGAQ